MSTDNKNITWNKKTDTTYQAEAYRATTWTAVITKTGNNHALVVNPGAIAVGTYATLKAAKNAFRVFLRDKPAKS